MNERLLLGWSLLALLALSMVTAGWMVATHRRRKRRRARRAELRRQAAGASRGMLRSDEL